MTVVEYDMRESDELAILRSHCQLEGRKLAISKMQRSSSVSHMRSSCAKSFPSVGRDYCINCARASKLEN